MPPVITVSKRKKTGGLNRKTVFGVTALVLICAIGFVIFKQMSGKIALEEKAVEVSSGSPINDIRQTSVSNTCEALIADTNLDSTITVADDMAPAVETPRTNAVWLARKQREEKQLEGYTGGSLEAVILSMLKGSHGGGIPPTPLGSEAELRAALANAITNDIVVFEDDDENAVAMKESVADFKQQLQEILEGGGNVKDALLEYQTWANERLKRRAEVTAEYIRLKKEESPEIALQYLSEANKELEADGFDPVTLGEPKPRYRPKRKPKQEN